MNVAWKSLIAPQLDKSYETTTFGWDIFSAVPRQVLRTAVNDAFATEWGQTRWHLRVTQGRRQCKKIIRESTDRATAIQRVSNQAPRFQVDRFVTQQISTQCRLEVLSWSSTSSVGGSAASVRTTTLQPTCDMRSAIRRAGHSTATLQFTLTTC